MDWLRRTPSVDTIRQDARRALEEGRLEDARAGFREAIDRGADDATTWFNLGLVEKLSRNWQESVASNRRAAELDPDLAEAHWNLGVAATALRDWDSARWAWRRLGIETGESGPPNADYGLTPVRLNATSAGSGEVVWATRIDPCRARIRSVPIPESGHRFGDVVLHDVVPRGTRQLGSANRSVFDELIRMDPSDLPTHEVEADAATGPDLAALLDAFIDRDLGAEDWSSIAFVCAQCSLSNAHGHRAGRPEPTWSRERRIGLAAPTDVARELVATWVAGAEGRAAGEPRQVG